MFHGIIHAKHIHSFGNTGGPPPRGHAHFVLFLPTTISGRLLETIRMYRRPSTSCSLLQSSCILLTWPRILTAVAAFCSLKDPRPHRTRPQISAPRFSAVRWLPGTHLFFKTPSLRDLVPAVGVRRLGFRLTLDALTMGIHAQRTYSAVLLR